MPTPARDHRLTSDAAAWLGSALPCASCPGSGSEPVRGATTAATSRRIFLQSLENLSLQIGQQVPELSELGLRARNLLPALEGFGK